MSDESQEAPVSADPEKLFADLAHGDDDHREWLHEAILAHFDGKPVPEARGGSAKDKQIYELTSQLAALKSEVERLREAMRRVLAHSVHLPAAKYELLEGLLASVKRISTAALARQEPRHDQ